MISFYSPYDPLFFLHHGLIDYFWAQWQETHVTGPWRPTDGDTHMLNALLWDGSTDTFPVRDVALNMDIRDDNPWTANYEETACVKYHEREENHACQPRWERIKSCFSKLVDYEKLHTVPRIRNVVGAGDVCDPINNATFDDNRLWLETMVQAGMMEPSHVDTVLEWEKRQLDQIERTTEVLDWEDHKDNEDVTDEERECDKSLCFSPTKMLQICDACESATEKWSIQCHCSEVSTAGCWESRSDLQLAAGTHQFFRESRA